MDDLSIGFRGDFLAEKRGGLNMEFWFSMDIALTGEPLKIDELITVGARPLPMRALGSSLNVFSSEFIGAGRMGDLLLILGLERVEMRLSGELRI